ncbi:MAG: GNAT family N-acetyltransferase [Actinomycetales bacterium]
MSDHHDDVLSSLSAGRTPEGLPTTSRGGPDVSVRPTIPGDADALGAIHAATMRASLAAGAGLSPDDEALTVIEAGNLALTWANAAAVTERGHYVLTALDAADVVGLAALAPAAPATEEEAAQLADAAQAARSAQGAPGGQADVPSEPGGAEVDSHRAAMLEILALEIRPDAERVGHGSRLLAACADLARDAGATALSIWTVRGDEARQKFLDAAGFAPTGRRREIPVGPAEAVQDEWWAALGEH